MKKTYEGIYPYTSPLWQTPELYSFNLDLCNAILKQEILKKSHPNALL